MENIKKDKQKKKIPVGMILLSIFLIWNIFKQVRTVLSGHVSVDFGILDYYNLLIIGNILFFVMLTLNILSIYAIFSRKKLGYKILLFFFILNILLIVFMYILSISNLDLLKGLAFQSRRERGLSTEAIDFAINPIILGIVSLLFSIFYLFLIYYVHKRKDYFNN